MWPVSFHDAAKAEFLVLRQRSLREAVAVENAVRKLEAMGPALPYPHQSGVQGATGLRELRPRAGNAPWRALYCQLGGGFVILAVAPEAQVDRDGFDTGVRTAMTRWQVLLEGSR